MGAQRIVTRHLVKRTALRELARLWKVQERAAVGNVPDASAELLELRITTATKLGVRHEPRRLMKWAVCALS